MPNITLVTNIGFREDGTHTKMANHVWANLPYAEMTFPLKHPPNDSLQQYNAVIDELALANGIEVAPPDFYSYFEQIYLDEFTDVLHPNGEGYRSMAVLWFDAIMNPAS